MLGPRTQHTLFDALSAGALEQVSGLILRFSLAFPVQALLGEGSCLLPSLQPSLPVQNLSPFTDIEAQERVRP